MSQHPRGVPTSLAVDYPICGTRPFFFLRSSLASTALARPRAAQGHANKQVHCGARLAEKFTRGASLAWCILICFR